MTVNILVEVTVMVTIRLVVTDLVLVLVTLRGEVTVLVVVLVILTKTLVVSNLVERTVVVFEA